MKVKSGSLIRNTILNKTYLLFGSAMFIFCIIMLSFTHSRVEAAITVPGFVVDPEPFLDQTQSLIVTFKDAQLEGNGIEKRDETTAKAVDKSYDGKGYISYFFEESNTTKGSATFKVEVPEGGLYELSLGYYIPEGNGDKTTSIQVNGSGAGELTLNAPNPGQVRAEKKMTKVLLTGGSNSIQILRGWGYYGIENIKLERVDPQVSRQVIKMDTLSNSKATPQAKALLDFMTSQYGKKIISGQQTLEDTKWIYKHTGKFPALVSSDLMDYSPSRVENGSTSKEVEKMIEWYERGGIVSLSWHWNAPKGIGGNEPGQEWWRGFNTEFTTFDVEYALNHPESDDYKLLIRDIDAIAVQLKRLQDQNVPVLWRPLHEAEGGWFWWGAKGPEPAKKLYRLMYKRLTYEHQLDNLIWVWNSVKEEWYPGDDVVDMVSVDVYNPPGDHSPNIAKYDELLFLSKHTKLVALAENGPIPDPDLLQTYGAHWSFFNTWTGAYLRDGKTNTKEHLKKVYNHDDVITLDELPKRLYGSP